MYAAVGQAVREIVWVAGLKKHKQANTTAAVRNCTVRNLMMIHGIQYKFTDAVADVSWCVFAVAINVKEQNAQLFDIRLTTDTFSAQRFLRMERIDGEVDVGRGILVRDIGTGKTCMIVLVDALCHAVLYCGNCLFQGVLLAD